MNSSPEMLAAACSNLLRLDPPPKEEEIDDVLERIATAFGAEQNVKDEARRLLHARFAIIMNLGQTLVGDGDHDPWLDARRASIDPFYWARYREFLLRNGWPPLVTATLDRATDELLDLAGNPAELFPWKRRGLVVGDVQSGKTASYAALICKAADAGYRFIVLLTGTLENVRRQTQERLDAAFIGFDSRDYLGNSSVRHKKRVGVGMIDGRRDGVVFTSRDHDFRKNAATALNISLAAVHEPILVVTKKNKGVLERLGTWLRARNADQEGRIDVPLLMIDDEADNASINTKQNPTETTAINKAIRDLLAMFKRSTYVGFTATPFANIFIDPHSEHEMLGDDLFPRDFVHVLEPPTNYIGMNVLFPSIGGDEEAEAYTQTIHSIYDEESWLPIDHKKDFEPGSLPESMKSALRHFLLATTIRDLRSAGGKTAEGGGLHRSMLVNVSRFTDVQNRVADALHVELDELRRSIRLYGALSPHTASSQSPEISSLERLFEAHFGDCGKEWEEVLGALHESVAPIRVQAVNQSSRARALDYSVADSPPGVRVIAVGGNSLSRGLTLEGLSTSYFIRNSRGYDTLLQMGRWFGYRDGYRDLCGIWLTEEAEGWYRHITLATSELKRDFVRMKRRKATPMEFGLRVRTHPDALLITARNKMATGIDVEEVWDVSLTGRMIESSRLYRDSRRNRLNLEIVDRWLQKETSEGNAPIVSPHGGALLWQCVPAIRIADLLEEFLVHPLNFDFQGESIADFLRNEAQTGLPDLSSWTVAVLTSGEAKFADGRPVPGSLNATGPKEFGALKRRVVVNEKLGSILVSGKSARVGSRSDIRHAFTKEEYEAQPSGVAEDVLRAALVRPLLVIYLLCGYERQPPGSEDRIYLDGQVLPALGLHFPGEKTPDPRRIRYRINRIAQAELFPTVEDDEERPVDDQPED